MFCAVRHHDNSKNRESLNTFGQHRKTVAGESRSVYDGGRCSVECNMKTSCSGNIEPGSKLITDEWRGYSTANFEREVINHAEAYVRGLVHTNGIENFWSLLKRGLNGTYVSVEPFHLFRYIDEQAFRFNNRKLTDAQRFDIATRGMVGKRLTYAEITGKVLKQQEAF
jgi:hypothetical protein